MSPASTDPRVESLLQDGMSAVSRGKFDTALDCFTRAQEHAPRHPVALINRGSLLASLGRLEEALACFVQVPDGEPLQVEALSNAGCTLRRLGRLEEALECLNRAHALKPRHGLVLINRGLTLSLQERWEEASADLEAGVSELPRHLDGLTGLGRAFAELGRRALALAAVDRALAIHPLHLPALNTRAYLLIVEERHEAALSCIEAILSQDPANLEALSNRGCALLALGRIDESLHCLEQALERDSQHVGALDNYGAALQRARRHRESLQYLDRALALQPHHPGALHNRAAALLCLQRFEEALDTLARMGPERCAPRSLRLHGQILLELSRHEEALERFDAAFARDPADATSVLLRGITLEALVRTQEAREALDRVPASDSTGAQVLKLRGVLLDRLCARGESLFMLDRALALDARCAETRYSRSLVLLALGRIEEGFLEMEARWSMPHAQPPHLPSTAPLWLGAEPIRGKTLLVDAEQGLGDTLQFARYVPAAMQRGARVIFRANELLHRVLATLPGRPVLVSDREPAPDHDLRCPVMSLPLAFGTTLLTIPAPVPYLHADAAAVARWELRLGPRKRPRIGIVWAGRQHWPVNHRRDIPLELLRPLFWLPADFIGLQKDMPLSDRMTLTQIPGLANLGEQLSDFADTAGLLENIDLLISVDTSVVHLAGALGRPVWVMNRYAACWRWLEGRTDSPWYPGMRLYRQRAHGDWQSVVTQVMSAAESWLQGCERGQACSVGY